MDNLGFGCSLVEPQCISSDEIHYSISALEQSTGTSYQSILKIPAWDSKGDLCGKVIGIETCKNHPENSKFITHRCFDPRCTFCWTSWIGRQVNRAEERLLKAKELYENKEFSLGAIKHITISPPQTLNLLEQIKTIGGIRKLRKDCTDYLRKLGALGGLIIFHAWRIKAEYRYKFAEYKRNGGEGALWDWVREKGLLNEAVYLSPHFHALLYGYLKDSDLAHQDFLNNKRTNRFDNWIYKNIEPDVEGGRDIKRTVAYQLNHCTLVYWNVYENRPIQALTWFGMISTNKMVRDEERSRTETLEPICKECNEPIHKFVDKENDSINIPIHVFENPETIFIFCNLHDLGEVKQKIVINEYKIKQGSWFYQWRKRKRKTMVDGTVIHDGMVLKSFIP